MTEPGSAAQRCVGVALNGGDRYRCGRKTRHPSGYCWQHRHQAQYAGWPSDV